MTNDELVIFGLVFGGGLAYVYTRPEYRIILENYFKSVVKPLGEPERTIDLLDEEEKLDEQEQKATEDDVERIRRQLATQMMSERDAQLKLPEKKKKLADVQRRLEDVRARKTRERDLLRRRRLLLDRLDLQRQEKEKAELEILERERRQKELDKKKWQDEQDEMNKLQQERNEALSYVKRKFFQKEIEKWVQKRKAREEDAKRRVGDRKRELANLEEVKRKMKLARESQRSKFQNDELERQQESEKKILRTRQELVGESEPTHYTPAKEPLRNSMVQGLSLIEMLDSLLGMRDKGVRMVPEDRILLERLEKYLNDFMSSHGELDADALEKYMEGRERTRLGDPDDYKLRLYNLFEHIFGGEERVDRSDSGWASK